MIQTRILLGDAVSNLDKKSYTSWDSGRVHADLGVLCLQEMTKTLFHLFYWLNLCFIRNMSIEIQNLILQGSTGQDSSIKKEEK